MTLDRVDLLRGVLEQGIGAEVVVQTDNSGLRTGLRTHFSGLTQHQGPVCTVAPAGLRRHKVTVRFGKFSGECVTHMQAADQERQLVARALVQSVATSNEVRLLPSQELESWLVTGPDFGLDVSVKDVPEPTSEDAVVRTAKNVMVPLMAAMAELIGYDDADSANSKFEVREVEGRINEETVRRRERSRRNRLLCLSIHGHRCMVCGCTPGSHYGEAGTIIEVHHLEPLSLIDVPRPYDPRSDLVPLCPNCHRAIHTRKPIPYSVEELRELMLRA